MTETGEATLVLASGSATRRALLKRAGIAVTVDAPVIDEGAVKRAMAAEGRDAGPCALALAERKARSVSDRHPGRLVIGADQILDLDGAWLDKPGDAAEAATQLRRLRGRSHTLVSAVAVLRDGRSVWQAVDRASLTVRDFGDAFLETYLRHAGAGVLGSVGAYELEGLGVQLFERVAGDFFTILGLPLLPLMSFLRGAGAIPA